MILEIVDEGRDDQEIDPRTRCCWWVMDDYF